MSYAQTSAVAGTRYAGFGVRLVAYLVDIIMVSVFGAVINILAWISGADASQAIAGVLTSALSARYFIYFWGSRGQTPGKRVLGQRVVGPGGATGGIGYGRAALRWIGGLVSAFILMLGYLWIIWDPRSRAGTTRSPAPTSSAAEW